MLLRSMILILNSNLTSLNFYENWLFNMVSELGFAGGQPPLCKFEYLFRICMVRRAREVRCLKAYIHIEPKNPTTLSFLGKLVV